MQKKREVVELQIECEGKGKYYVELGELRTIGRSKKNHIVLDDPKASRRHAEIRKVGMGRYQLTDLGSINGTWLNGRVLKTPKDLADGDVIIIGQARLSFIAASELSGDESTTTTDTMTLLRSELVVVLVSDIRGYTHMIESLPKEDLSSHIKDWFSVCIEIIRSNDGNLDKFIGDAVLAYWVVGKELDPGREINQALKASRSLVRSARDFSTRFSENFPGYIFRIGVGLSMGEALHLNVGAARQQSFTIVGDCVNLAFRIESQTKKKQAAIILIRSMTEYADNENKFFDLGKVKVEGRREPVTICGLSVD